MTLLLNHELVSRAKLCLVSVFPDIVKDCPKMRNLPKIFLISFENVAPDDKLSHFVTIPDHDRQMDTLRQHIPRSVSSVN